MLNSLSSPQQKQFVQPQLPQELSPLRQSSQKTIPQPTHSSPSSGLGSSATKISNLQTQPLSSELLSPVPLDLQQQNEIQAKSLLSKSSSAVPSRTTAEINTKLTQSTPSKKSTKKVKEVEEGLCLQTGEIKAVNKNAQADDRETKRRMAMEAFGLGKDNVK